MIKETREMSQFLIGTVLHNKYIGDHIFELRAKVSIPHRYGTTG